MAAVAIELTQVLEEYVRGQRSPNVTETLVLCSKIYPSLFDELSARTKELAIEDSLKKSARPKKETENKTTRSKREPEAEPATAEQETEKEELAKVTDAEEKDNGREEAKPDPKKEYVEGFWSKRELPRTPPRPK